MYNGTLIEDLGKTVAKADHLNPIEDGIVARASLPDYMSYEECRAVAEKDMADNHAEILKIANGDAIANFAIRFATMVAWKCAAEATRRAKQRV